VDSKLGEGSVFTLTLPLEAAPAQAEETVGDGVAAPWSDGLPANADEAYALGRLVLVAEDNATNREIIGRQLEGIGILAEMAVDGEQALALWRLRRHPLVITDCHMPELDGFDLARAIRRQEEDGIGRTILVAATASVAGDDIAACRAAKMDDWLAKPIEAASLAAMLAKWLPAWHRNAMPDGEALVRQDPSVGEGGMLFDPQALVPQVGGDPVVMVSILRSFIRPATETFEELIAAIDREDTASAVRAAHKLKSSSRSVGAGLLADQCEAVEDIGKATDQTLPTELANRLSILFEDTKSAILRHIAL
jgi:CheY-like chemotaxis protein/HPt (histidine-containing phosphotransfer) domain-containing protein